jgi:hypothetical protein
MEEAIKSAARRKDKIRFIGETPFKTKVAIIIQQKHPSVNGNIH